jgi:hypothetical protein
MKTKYKRIWSCTLPAVALGLILTIGPLPSLGQDTTAAEPQKSNPNAKGSIPEPDTWARYQIILQRNIFSRQRGPLTSRQLGERPGTVVTPDPESYFLLKGIVQEAGTFIAFLEDSRSNEVLKLREGDHVARGIVKNFTLDSIEYQFEDRTISVPLGRDLKGGQGAMTMNRLLELSATSAPAGEQKGASAQPAPSGNEAEILKKLVEQRKQQLGQ